MGCVMKNDHSQECKTLAKCMFMGSIKHKACRHRFQNPSIYSSFGSRAARRIGLVVLFHCVLRDVYNRISCQNSCSLYQSTTSHLRVFFFFCYHSFLAPSIDFAVWIKGIGDIIKTPSARNVWRLIRVIEIKWNENECLSLGWKKHFWHYKVTNLRGQKQNLQEKNNLLEFDKQPTKTSAYHTGWKFNKNNLAYKSDILMQ